MRKTPPEAVEEVALPDLGEEGQQKSSRVARQRPKPETVAEKPARKRRGRAPKGDPLDRRGGQSDDVPDGWVRDRKSGVLHKYIPKTEMDEDNMPVLHLDDLDLDDLTGEADKYLAHLRVPPDREEMARLLKEKAERARAQNKEYFKANPAEEDSSSSD